MRFRAVSLCPSAKKWQNSSGSVITNSNSLFKTLYWLTGKNGFYLDAKGSSCGCIAVNNFAIFVHQELGEIPFDVVTKESTFAWLQKLVQWSSTIAIHINLNWEQKLKVVIECHWLMKQQCEEIDVLLASHHLRDDIKSTNAYLCAKIYHGWNNHLKFNANYWLAFSFFSRLHINWTLSHVFDSVLQNPNSHHRDNSGSLNQNNPGTLILPIPERSIYWERPGPPFPEQVCLPIELPEG